MASKWTKVDEDSYVLLEYPCTNRKWCSFYDISGESKDSIRAHGHVRIACDDGSATIPAQVESRAFLAFLLQHEVDRKCLTCKEMETILSLPETNQLHERMTDRERKVVADSELLKKWTSYGYCSAW